MSQNVSQQNIQFTQKTHHLLTNDSKIENNQVLTIVDIYTPSDLSNQGENLSLPPLQKQKKDNPEYIKLEKNYSENESYSPKQQNSQKNLSETNKNFSSFNSAENDFSISSNKIQTKCCNKLCLKKGIKEIKSKRNGLVSLLCQDCSKLYYDGKFCEFCQQIYGSQQVDGLQWIQCETKDCGRWKHTECSQISFVKKPRDQYFCIKCRNQNNVINVNSSQSVQFIVPSKTFKRGPERIQQNRIKLFDLPTESFRNLESLLCNYSYRLSLTQDQLKNDSIFVGFKYISNDQNLYPGHDRAYKKRKIR